MIDTIKLFTDKFSLRNNHKFQLKTTVDIATGETKSSKVFCNQSHFNLDIKNKDGTTESDSFLYLQTSLPKLLFKTSLFEVSEKDIEQSVFEIQNRLDGAGVVIDKNNLNDFQLSRVDFCRNIKVDHNILDYLLLLSQYSLSRRDKIEIKKETVSFRNLSQDLTFYNKIKEILDTEKDENILTMIKTQEQNILRVESRLKQKRVIDRELKPDIKFVDIFSKKMSIGKMLKDVNSLVNRSKQQIDFNFKENSDLLKYIESKRKRNSFKEFLAVKGVKQFLFEFQFDYHKIREFLLNHGYSRMQTYRLIGDLKLYQELILDSQNRDLIGEIKYKIAA